MPPGVFVIMTEKTYKKYCLVVDEWFANGFNGTKAYQKIYPKASEETAAVEFLRILSFPKIQEYKDQKHKEVQDTIRTSHEALLKELENWAYSDITETLLLTPEQVKELPVELRRLITKYKHTKRHIRNKSGDIVETVERVELWFVDKAKAMEMIHKHTGFYEKDNDQRKGPVINQVLNIDPLKMHDTTDDRAAEDSGS